uniref:Uncharacterized protein n=1 Tax=Arundo donax TaxID=35708 RepID=A0A0A9C2T6_ARUDO
MQPCIECNGCISSLCYVHVNWYICYCPMVIISLAVSSNF